ncbi:MAG: BatD family protein [Candidatus Omnitrophica bacterium]|nr:BatD family protein [Candidatus Omnitrophota bacterium]
MGKFKHIAASLKFLILSVIFVFYTSSFTFTCFAKELSFEATVDRNKVSLGGSLQLALSFSNAQDVPAPELPAIDGFQSRYLGPSTMMSIVNGKVSGSVTHNYVLLPAKIGTFKIGPFKFEHNGDKYTSNQLSVEVLKGQVQSSAAQPSSQSEPAAELGDLNDRLFVTMQTEKDKAYLNETVLLTIKLYVNRLGIRDIQFPEFNHEGFSAGAFNKPNQYQEVRSGVNFDVIEFNTSIFGLRPGEFKLGPAHIKCNLIVQKQRRSKSPFASNDPFNASIFDDFFGRYETYPLDLKSGDIAFTILSLPEENKPANFSGAMGRFELKVTAAPLEVKLGDPITLKMVVSGEGNFNTVGVPKLKSEKGFKIYEPQIKQQANEKMFEQIIMPMSLEIEEIPVISLDFFDIGSGQYKTINRGPFPIIIVKPEKEEETKVIENKQPSSISLVKEERLGRDIIYIKDNPGPLRKRSDYFYRNKIFLGFQVVPLLFYLLTAVIYAKRQRLKTDLRYARGLLAPRKAKAGIRLAKKYLDKTDTQKFYDTLFLTMQEYLGDKFHLSSKGITISVTDEHLRKEEVAEEVLVKLRDIFRECDMVRYASSQLTQENMRESLSKLEQIIDYLQRKKA